MFPQFESFDSNRDRDLNIIETSASAGFAICQMTFFQIKNDPD